MRPHRLALTAFGPFPSRVEVDLDALSEAGLFLLHGDTGAGKSTLLDALGFALYGTVPGARSRARRYRSDYAAGGEGWLRTEVTLEATVGGRRIRVTRAPEQERPRRRGTGLTTEPARVLLEELRGGGWETVSTRVGEADAEIGRLVGMSAEQFFQVVLLPQGEFARFLRAESGERSALLERLFATDRFRRTEEWLAEERRRCNRRLEAAGEAVARTASRVAQAAGEADPAPELPGPDWALGLLAAAREVAAAAGAARTAALAELEAARTAELAAAGLAGRQQARREALVAAELLAAQQVETARLAAELDAAGRAAEAGPLLDRAAAAATAGAEAAKELADACAAADGADPGQAAALAAAARERAGELEALRPVEQAARQEQAAAIEAERAAARLAGVCQEAQQQAAEVGSRHASTTAKVAAAHAAQAAVPVLQARAARLTAALAAARERVALEAESESAQARELAARTAYLELRGAEQALREGYLSSLVRELSAALEPGAPCPVCGALQHPTPASGAGPRIEREQLDAAAAAAERAGEQREQEARAAAAVQERLAGVSDRLREAGVAPGADPDGLAAELTPVAADLAARSAAADALADLLTDLAALEQEREEAAGELVARSRAADAAAAAAASAAATAEHSRAAVARSLAGAGSVEQALAAARNRAAALDTVAAAAARSVTAHAERTAAGLAAAAAAREQGFADQEAARAARRSATWRKENAAACRLAQEQELAARTRLGAPELAVDLAVDAGLPAARERLAAAEARHDQAVGLERLAGHQAVELGQLVPNYTGELAALEPVREQHERVSGLADLCTGRGANTKRMTLSAFVLAARLEEVAAAASERLLRMTQGRYRLVHTDGGGRSGVRTGLGLLARDSWTGQDRDTATLSGGETFLASLALALGLADVVLAEAGGSPIEALFVDEGFGTLDETTLEEVMDVLDGLREGGRLVGLVSHVAELQSRIPAQVHVHKGRGGSRLSVTAG